MKALLAIALSACALVPSAPAPAVEVAPSCKPVAVESARNRDGSVLSVRTECPDEGTRLFVIELQCPGGATCDRLEVEQSVEESSTGSASVRDLAGDGRYMVEVRGSCGAGPNCAGDLYGVSTGGHSLMHFFSGGYADISVRDGWLVESGRASCCSWEFHMWKLDAARGQPLQYDNMDLMAQVGVLFGEGGVDERFDCRFTRSNGDSIRVVEPPSDALEERCPIYGDDYVLAPPDPLSDPAPVPGDDGHTLEH